MLAKNIVKLRVCVGFLGEKEQACWWPSSFLSRSGEAFLAPIFPKTSALAQVNGASGAAQLAHDEHIGVGDVHHLFRLPENIENDVSQFLIEDPSILELFASEDTAQAGLQELSSGDSTRGIGPLLIEGDELSELMISRMAAAYKQGFTAGDQVYPYFRANG